MKSKIGKVVILILLTLGAALFSYQLIKCAGYVFRRFNHYYWFFGGGVAYYLVVCLLQRKNLDFFQTWVHEFLHTVMCVVFFHRIELFQASAKKGGVVYHYGGPNMFISLAPYTFPFFTYSLLLVALIIPRRLRWFALFIGFSFFLHMHAIIKQTHPGQSDLTQNGLLLSYAFIITFLCMNICICFYGVDLGLWKGIQYFFGESWDIVYNIIKSI